MSRPGFSVFLACVCIWEKANGKISCHVPLARTVYTAHVQYRFFYVLGHSSGGSRRVQSVAQCSPNPPRERKMVLQRLEIGDVIKNRWKVLQRIGEGGFGAVYEVADTEDNSKRRALKVESKAAPVSERVLKMDSHILERIHDRAPEESRAYFCTCDMKGEMPTYHFLVMTLVGRSLFDLKRRCGGRFNSRTAMHLAICSLQAIRTIHDIDYLHRDIKPGNMAIGRPPEYRAFYLLDFGLCRFYRHDDGRLRRPREKTGFKGTLRYAALACHRGEEMCRRDDLWSWLYMAIEMITGALGWQQVLADCKTLPMQEQVNRIGNVKARLNGKPTLLMQSCPSEFMKIHSLIASLGFYAEPDYDSIVAALKAVEDRRRQPKKDGELLDWEPNGRCGHLME